MGDPVSWLLIRPGWKVYASDGREVGEVDEVVGDSTRDIFDGLAIATSALGTPRYVPSERVGPIEDGGVHLELTREDVDALGEYLEPATSAEIEPESRGGAVESLTAEARELEGEAVAPIQRREQSPGLVRRIYLWLRRKTS